jgi:hypothetical protein
MIETETVPETLVVFNADGLKISLSLCVNNKLTSGLGKYRKYNEVSPVLLIYNIRSAKVTLNCKAVHVHLSLNIVLLEAFGTKLNL